MMNIQIFTYEPIQKRNHHALHCTYGCAAGGEKRTTSYARRIGVHTHSGKRSVP